MTDPMRMLDGQPADLDNSIYDFDAMSIEKFCWGTYYHRYNV